MGKKKYVAYVGTYTHGTSKGIQVYDVDVENGTLTERSEVEVSNASHLAVSKNGKYLYSIEDEGVAVFERDENGDLSRINSVDINGMRGCYLATDVDGRYLYVAGYHDGKVTVVHTHKDGRLGSVMDGVFHKGLGSVAERNFRPHVNCVRPTPDNKYLCAVDNGIDQVKIYRIMPSSPITGSTRRKISWNLWIFFAARERAALVLSVSVMTEDLHIFFLSSAMRLRYTAMTEAARTRSFSCSRVLPLLEKKMPMMRFTTQHQVCLFLRMANIFSAQLQVRTQ